MRFFLLGCLLCVTVGVKHDRSTLVLGRQPRGHTQCPSTLCERQPLWEGRERSKLLILSPPNGFLSRSLFHTLPSLVGNEPTRYFPTISCARFIQHRFVQHPGNVQRCIISPRGMGKKESGGLGEKTQKGKGDKHGNAPPFPGVVSPRQEQNPQACPGTQIIIEPTKETGHPKETRTYVLSALQEHMQNFRQNN